MTTSDWRHSVDVGVVLGDAEVQRLVAAAGRESARPADAATFLAGFDSTIRGLTGGTVSSLNPTAAGASAFWSKVGVRTRRKRAEDHPGPGGELIASVLVSMARQCLPLTGAEQTADGCVLEAEIPSDWRTFGGVVKVRIERREQGFHVRADTVVPGQGFDWGRGRKILRQLFDDVAIAPGAT